MSVKQMTDNVFDALLRQAVIDNFFDELESLPSAGELAVMFKPSEAHKTRMKRLFTAEKRKEILHTTLVWSKRVAAVITIATTILFASLMLVPEVRAIITDTIIEWHERFARFAPSSTTDANKTKLEPMYIPDGFSEEMRDNNETMSIILYMNKNNELITFQSSLSEATTLVDSEDRVYETRNVEGVEYHIFAAEGSKSENIIVWDNQGQRYIVISTISIDELLKMALSVS